MVHSMRILRSSVLRLKHYLQCIVVSCWLLRKWPCVYSFSLFLLLFVFVFEIGFLCRFRTCPGTNFCRPGWPHTHRDPPASASCVSSGVFHPVRMNTNPVTPALAGTPLLLTHFLNFLLPVASRLVPGSAVGFRVVWLNRRICTEFAFVTISGD